MATRKNDPDVFEVDDMGKVKPVRKRRSAPASDPDAREEQMIALAVDLAEQQLMDGTASSAVITHYLKLGSKTARIEREILRKQAKLLEAKTDAIENGKNQEQMAENAIAAMRMYQGVVDP